MIQGSGATVFPVQLLGMAMAASPVTATSATHCSRQLLALQQFSRSYNECSKNASFENFSLKNSFVFLPCVLNYQMLIHMH